MGDMMSFPESWEMFLHDYEFDDARRQYTNGARLIPSFRVKQMVEHYFHERLNPQPLTLDELRGMDGLPVWCVDCFGNQCWAIVNVADDDCIDNETGAWSMGLYGISDKPIDLTGWLAYRTKPEGREKHD
jgi:hypothetical protein